MTDETPIDETTFVVVDVETTGMSAERDRITEIALYTVRNNQFVNEFSTLVNPLVPIPRYITEMTGISNAMVRDAPPAWEIAPIVATILAGNVFVAHNASFDWGFVFHTLLRERSIELAVPALCTVRLARRVVPELRRRNLDAVTQHFDIRIPERHRASGDAYATAVALMKMIPLAIDQIPSPTIGELLRLQFRPKPRNSRYAPKPERP